MKCIFEVYSIEDSDKKRFKCINCGFITNPTKSQANQIDSDCVDTRSNYVRMGANFVKATIKHAANNGKTRPQEEIVRIYDICKDCPLFIATQEDKSSGYCSHKDCGCNVSGRPDQFLNKIAWESESCPIHKW